MGIPYKTSRGDRERAIRRYLAGDLLKNIAADLGVTKPAIRYYARMAGHPGRPQGNPYATGSARRTSRIDHRESLRE